MIYFIQAGGPDGPIKIGFSNHPRTRWRTLSAAWYEELHLLGATSGSLLTERDYHCRFEHLHINGEWFRAAPELLEHIATLPPLRGFNPPSRRKRGVRTRPAWSTDLTEELAKGNAKCRNFLLRQSEYTLLMLAPQRLYRGPARIDQRMLNVRRKALRGCKLWRQVLAHCNQSPFREKLRERQLHLAQLREWRRTGIEPRGIPGGLPLKPEPPEPRKSWLLPIEEAQSV